MAPQRWRRFDEDQTREGVGWRKLRVQNGFQQVVRQEAERQEPERGGRTGTHDARTEDLLFWPLAGARLVLDTWLSLLGETREPPAQPEAALPWATPHTIALELTTMRLRDFSTQAKGGPVLLCAPYALHSAVLTDFAPAHSIVQALQRGGVGRLFVTDWRSANTRMRYLSIDSYLADLNTAIDTIGPPVDLVGLCQGGWLSLLAAARFPDKVRRLVLVGAPVDISHQSPLSRMVANFPPHAFEALVDPATGLLSGKHLQPAWPGSPAISAEESLQRSLADGVDGADALRQRFARWDGDTLDLPGTYYVEIANWIFRENRIAEGRFVALGRMIDPSVITVPLFLLAGTEDSVVPADQALATAQLLGTPADEVQIALVPSSHLGLMMGLETIGNAWGRIADWLVTDLDVSGVHKRGHAHLAAE
jgi:poly(3-hydroxyalkanoate) synthetase